jgi:SH3-like domain-containing protein
MLMYRRYFWITRIAPLALVAAGVIALLPSDFKAAATSMTASAAVAQPAAAKPSMPLPKLLSITAIAALPTPIVTVSPDAAAPASVEPAAASADASASQLPDAGLAGMQDAQIGSSGVNVRAGASKDFAVLFTLQPGTSVKTREALNGWVHVYAGTGDGWIYSDYLAGNETRTAAAATAQSSPGDALVGRALRLRSQAQVYDSPGGERVYVLDAGERVRVADADDNWIRIVTDSDESGWLRLR